MNQTESNKNGKSEDSKQMLFVVDDEPMLLELAAMVLEPLGYHIRTFRDPVMAVQAFASANPPPALVITDYAMHTMTGMDLIRECRYFNPRQKILLVSGTVDHGIYRYADEKPDSFLAKPYRTKELADLVQGMIAE